MTKSVPFSNDIDLFEQTLTEFEAAWLRDENPSIEQYIQDWSGERRNDLLRELIWLDIDYQFRSVSGQDSGSRSSTKTISQFSGSRVLEGYWQRFPELGHQDRLSLEVIGEEYAARLRHVIPTQISEYRERFPWHGDLLAPYLQRINAELNRSEPRFQIIVYRDKQSLGSVGFCVEIEAGRQQNGEPLPVCRHEAVDRSRMILAAMNDRYLSRRHLHFSALNKKQIKLVNQSNVVDAIVNDTSTLVHGDSVILDLPFLIRLGQLVLRCQLA